VDAGGNRVPALDVVKICEAMGASVRVGDPFDIETTRQTIFELFEKKGLKVLVLKQICALSPEKKAQNKYDMSVDQDVCLGQDCGCNQLCTRIFKCPGLNWDKDNRASRIDEVICVGCGVCGSICPSGAIRKKEVVSN
jgi:indolepyruvate ferredoxin oxidoreductase alpha subunit